MSPRPQAQPLVLSRTFHAACGGPDNPSSPPQSSFLPCIKSQNRRKNKPLGSSDRGSLRRPLEVSCLDHTSLQCGLALQRLPPHRAAFQTPALPLKAKYTRAGPADGLCTGPAPAPSAVRGDTGSPGSPGTPNDGQLCSGHVPSRAVPPVQLC